MPGNYSIDGSHGNPYETIYDAFHDVSYGDSADDAVTSTTGMTPYGNLGSMQVAMEKPSPYFLNYQHLQTNGLPSLYSSFNEGFARSQFVAPGPSVPPEMPPYFFEFASPQARFFAEPYLSGVYDIGEDDRFSEIAEAGSPLSLPVVAELASPLPLVAKSPSPLPEQAFPIQENEVESSESLLDLKEPLKMALDDLIKEACSSSTDVVEKELPKVNLKKKNHWKVLWELRDKVFKLIDDHDLTDMADLKVLLSEDDRNVFVTRFKLLKKCQEKLEANKWAGMNPPSPVRFENNYWTLEKCKAEALKCDGKSEWRVMSQPSYSAATKNHWLAICTEHMTSEGKAVWTKEKCIKSARKFSNTSVWKKAQPGAYQLARIKDWMEECTEHMKRPYRKTEGKKPIGYWTLENCTAAARKCKTLTEFKERFSGAWKAIRKKQEWKAICETCFTDPHI